MLINSQWITEEIKEELNGFPGSPVVTNLSANARDTGLIPGPGRYHMPLGNQVPVSKLLSLHTATTEA